MSQNSRIEELKFTDQEKLSEELVALSKQRKVYNKKDIEDILSYFGIFKISDDDETLTIKNLDVLADRDIKGYNNFSLRQKLFLFKRTFLFSVLKSILDEKVLVPTYFKNNRQAFYVKEYIINGKNYIFVPVFSDSAEAKLCEDISETLVLMSLTEVTTSIQKNQEIDGIYINPESKPIPGISNKTLNIVISKQLLKKLKK